MTSKEKVLAVQYQKDLCFKCLMSKPHIYSYSLGCRGYGSIFDGSVHRLQLCTDCVDEAKHEEINSWFNELPTYIQEYCEDYKFEENIRDYIDNELNIQGRELFWNQTSDGWNSYVVEPQDWIDMKLEVAEDEVYKMYGYYTPSEIKAYQERFPTCKHVYQKIYSDGSGGTRCRKNSFVSGELDGSCRLNICKECYYCDDYEKKDELFEMKTEQTYRVKGKVIKLIEYFCPNCGTRGTFNALKSSSYDVSYQFCKKCFAEIEVEI